MDYTILTVLAEPNRLKIVEFLLNGPHTVGEIAEQLCIRQPQASKHLRVLYDAGVVDFYAEANRRIYTLRPEPFKEMDSWLDHYRKLWNEKFDNLDSYLQKLQRDEQQKKDD